MLIPMQTKRIKSIPIFIICNLVIITLSKVEMYVLCDSNIGEQTSAYDHGAPQVGGTERSRSALTWLTNN